MNKIAKIFPTCSISYDYEDYCKARFVTIRSQRVTQIEVIEMKELGFEFVQCGLGRGHVVSVFVE